jgi:hypothetical protein
MYRSYQSKTTPPSTPSAIKYLIGAFSLSLIISSLLNLFFINTLMYPVCEKWLSLSRSGLMNGYIWQLFTNPFISSNIGLGFSFIIHLLFTMYLVWMIGSMIIERVSFKSFLCFLICCSLGTSLAIGGTLLASPSLFVLSGISPILHSLILAWAMLYGEGVILIFFIIPMRIRTLAFGYLALITLMNLSAQNYIGILADLTGPVIAYFYCVLAWNLKAPFRPFHKFDNLLLDIKSSSSQLFLKIWAKDSSFASTKRYDFKTGKPLTTDDEFLDAMLDKISKKGKDSLSFRERWKMSRIVKKRRKD